MAERYELEALLREIEEDTLGEAAKAPQKLSQDEIRQRTAARLKARAAAAATAGDAAAAPTPSLPKTD
jgi:hypothetical protein